MRRRALLGALTVAAACNRGSSRRIGMVPKGATQLFWQAVHAGAVKASRERNVELVWNAPAQESDRSRQVAIMDAMINMGVDGIALAPVDRSALVNVAHRAIDRGIPVAVFDSALDSDRIVSYVATDNREGGRTAARRLGALLNGRGAVAVLDDMPGSASTTDRVNGFREECAAQFAGLSILPVQFVMADRAKARAVAENILTSHPGLAGVFADHENAAIGAAIALSARTNTAVKLVGFDASDQIEAYMRDGWIDSVVVQNPFRMGYEALTAVALKLEGKSTPSRVDTGSTLVRAEDLDKPEFRELISPDVKRWLG